MKTVIKISLLVLPFILFYTIGLFFLDSHLRKDNYLYGSLNKRERLENVSSPKMVFVGGSSMAFGLDSKKIEEQLDYSVVNMGLHADVGLKYMLLEIEDEMKEGDVIVLGAEYEQFLNYFYGGQPLVALSFDINKDYYKFFDFSSYSELSSSIHKYTLKKVAHSVLKSSNSGQVSEIYSLNSFNPYGDVVSHWNKSPKEYIYNFKMQPNISNDAFLFLKKFKNRMNKKNITLIIIPPIIQDSQFRLNEKIIKKINNKLEEESLDYSSPYSKYVFADSLFFDSPYHLNRKGIDIRMKHLIFDIKKHLNTAN
ncbi:hypothetical protein [Bernardetia sp.]|uniref:hypothetical protein n=1 Tax=Bernardetia sp. TaxID=1937974 RepID=UPI0025BF1501|nr:hypothetical protein [Bernardetia sp.]